MRRHRLLALLPLLATLGACHAVVLHPAGEVAAGQRDLLIEASALMLVIIVPVMVLTVLFAWRYRASNTAARYRPDWEHSIHLELVIWAAPLLIIICLGALTWVGTHLLDPYRPLGRTAAAGAAPAQAPLRVDVVALDWKWLFIYPDYGIATVNEVAAPVGRSIEFHITASSVMNSFYIPALAGQIYAMPGMQTQLAAVIDRPGDYEGFSANYSGAGFSDMHFVFHALPAAQFTGWIADVRAAGGTLSPAVYRALARPSEDEPVHRYATVDPGLYQSILAMCAGPTQHCTPGMPGMSGMTSAAPSPPPAT